jgi:putative flippase GtrA
LARLRAPMTHVETNSNAKKELGKFLIVGSSTVVVDYISYMGALVLGVNTPFAKTFGFLVGTTCAYFANRFWTFDAGQTEKSTLLPFLIVYAISLVVNVAVNQTLVNFFSFPGSLTFAFVVATGISATMNFIGMKFFVFNDSQ